MLETTGKTPSKNIKDAIRNIVMKTEEKSITGDELRNVLFKQGHNIPEVNVKIALMRSKGNLILESGIYKLGRQLKSELNEMSSMSQSVHGFANNSDIALVDKLLHSSLTSSPLVRNGVPINILLGSLKTFRKSGTVRKDIFFDSKDGHPASTKNKAREYIEKLSVSPTIERVLIKSSKLGSKRKSSYSISVDLLNKVQKSTKHRQNSSNEINLSLLKTSKSSVLNLLRRNYEEQVHGLKLKIENSSYDWSVLAELTKTELHQLVVNYVVAYNTHKENYKQGRIRSTEVTTSHVRESLITSVRTKQSEKRVRKTYGECTYKNCDLKSIDIALNQKNRFQMFKRHVQARHLKLVYGQCDYCAFPITKAVQNVDRRNAVKNHHLRVHLPIQLWPYSCGICDAKFINPSMLRDHLKQVHSGNVFTCFECGKQYSKLRAAIGGMEAGGLATHLKLKHGVVTSSANYKGNDGERLANINFKTKHNSVEARALLKRFGYELDKEYPETDFATNYNSKIEDMFKDMIKQ